MFRLHSTHTLYFLLFRIQVQGMVTPTGTSLPIPVNRNKITPHRPASRPLFQVILDLIELMIEINHHFFASLFLSHRHSTD